MTSASARTRRSGSASPVSAFTRARVWKVDTSGSVELVLEAVAGHARQPVVGVEGVDVTEALEVTAHPVGEGVDHLRELLLGEVGRTGLDVHHPEPGLDLDHLGRVGVPAPHEHVGLHAGLGQGGHELAHVDVHAPAVALAGLGERRRVQGEDGESAHHRGRATGGPSEINAPRRPVLPRPGIRRRRSRGRNDA